MLDTLCGIVQTEKAALRTVTKPIGGEKNGKERVVVLNKGPKWYPADDVKQPVPSRKHIHKPTKLRKSIKPGSVLILLTGAYSGMRVVFLKQLESGLLLVTGPFCINGIPMKRVDQRFVIATSTTVDISGTDLAKFDDAYFKQQSKSAEAEGALEDEKEEKKVEVTDERKADQKAVDKAIVAAVAKTDMLKDYLRSKFTLSKGQYPHLMAF